MQKWNSNDFTFLSRYMHLMHYTFNAAKLLTLLLNFDWSLALLNYSKTKIYLSAQGDNTVKMYLKDIQIYKNIIEQSQKK